MGFARPHEPLLGYDGRHAIAGLLAPRPGYGNGVREWHPESLEGDRLRDLFNILASCDALIQLLAIGADKTAGAACFDLLDSRPTLRAGLAIAVADQDLVGGEPAGLPVQVLFVEGAALVQAGL